MTVCAVNQVPFNIIRDRLADAFHTLTQHASNFPGISFEYADMAVTFLYDGTHVYTGSRIGPIGWLDLAWQIARNEFSH